MPVYIRTGGSLNKLIDKLPVELHIPGYNYCGPGTRLRERLARGDAPVNRLDTACREHDIRYNLYQDTENRRRADRKLADRSASLLRAKNVGIGERLSALGVLGAMKAKRALGSGLKIKRTNKPKKRKGTTEKKIRKLPIAHRGGFLPILAALGALGSLAGGAAGIAKAVSDARTNKAALAELKRHDLALEGRGLYLKPYKGKGMRRKTFLSKKKNHATKKK